MTERLTASSLPVRASGEPQKAPTAKEAHLMDVYDSLGVAWGDDVFAAIRRLQQTRPVQIPDPKVFWRCFHCGYIAITEEQGREHFGATRQASAMCQDVLQRASDFDDVLGRVATLGAASGHVRDARRHLKDAILAAASDDVARQPQRDPYDIHALIEGPERKHFPTTDSTGKFCTCGARVADQTAHFSSDDGAAREPGQPNRATLDLILDLLAQGKPEGLNFPGVARAIRRALADGDAELATARKEIITLGTSVDSLRYLIDHPVKNETTKI